MSHSFDVQAFNEPACRKILGLEGNATISDWYSLLGIDKFESDEAKIAQAMQQRFELVRRYQVGNYEEQSQRLLDELGRARACLTNERKRREYNETLGSQTGEAFNEAIEAVHFNDVVEAIAVPAELPIGAAASAVVGKSSEASESMEPKFWSASRTPLTLTGSDDATKPRTADQPSEKNDQRTCQRRVAPVESLVTKELGRVALAIWTRVQWLDALLATLAGGENPLRHQLFRALVLVVPLALIGGLSFHIAALQKQSQAERAQTDRAQAQAEATLVMKQELKDAKEAWSTAWDGADRDLLAKYASASPAVIDEKARLAATLAKSNDFREAAVLYRQALAQLSAAQADVSSAIYQELKDAQDAWSTAWQAVNRDLLAKYAAASLAAIEETTEMAETRSKENKFREAAVLYRQALAELAQVDLAQAELARAAEVTNSIGMKLALIWTGEFPMGSPKMEVDRESDEDQHRVTLSKDFYLGATEVTQSQWQSVMGTTPWKGERDVKEGANYPATKVSWKDAMEFCWRLSAMSGEQSSGRGYRLPTEAEWEYACRGGTTTAYSFGDDASGLSDNGWFAGNTNSERYAHEVGLKRANSFGLYDMHGNAWEWCMDWKARYPTGTAIDPEGPSLGSIRINRGGSWDDYAANCRSASRNSYAPNYRSCFLGFRVAAVQADDTLAMKYAKYATWAMKKELNDAQEAWSTVWDRADRDRLAKFATASLAAIKAKTALAETRSQENDFPEAALLYRQALALLSTAQADATLAMKQELENTLGTAAEVTNSLGMKLALIPAGSFLMGSPKSEVDRGANEQQHEVTLSKGFYLGTTEVTQGQWQAVMGTTPWQGTSYVKDGSNYPASLVSWGDAMGFCQKLSAIEGKTYSLPTESQWEYACRGGTTTAYSFGDDASRLSDYGWVAFKGNIDYSAHEVGMKRANSFGLYDMHGNVTEWCLDWYGDYPTGSVTDPLGSSSGLQRVARGGSLREFARVCRSANRGQRAPVNRGLNLGFRVALVR